jgi:hypothetical protein
MAKPVRMPGSTHLNRISPAATASAARHQRFFRSSTKRCNAAVSSLSRTGLVR